DVRVISKKRGSVRLTLALTPEQAEKLLWAAKAGELSAFGVVDASIRGFGEPSSSIDLPSAPQCDEFGLLEPSADPRAFAEKLFAFEALQSASASAPSVATEPYSLQWFLDSRCGRWIPDVLEFATHSGDTLLG